MHGAFADFQHRGDFRRIELFEVPQDEHFAIAVRESIESRAHAVPAVRRRMAPGRWAAACGRRAGRPTPGPSASGRAAALRGARCVCRRGRAWRRRAASWSQASRRSHG